MARIKTLKFKIHGNEYKSHINFSPKTGKFSTTLDWAVANAIGVENRLEGDTLISVTSPVNNAYQAYKDSQKKYELFIAIKYQCSGKFAKSTTGHELFNYYTSEFSYKDFLDGKSALLFGFGIYCKETNPEGIESWYSVRENRPNDEIYSWTILLENSRFRLGHPEFTSPTGKIIPYSEEAIESLNTAQEGIRKISEMLIIFLSQDEDDIFEKLNSGGLTKSLSDGA